MAASARAPQLTSPPRPGNLNGDLYENPVGNRLVRTKIATNEGKALSYFQVISTISLLRTLHSTVRSFSPTRTSNRKR